MAGLHRGTVVLGALLIASTVAMTASAQTTTPVTPAAGQGGPAQRPAPEPPQVAWTLKKTPYAAYTAPNRAWWKMSDVLAAHRGQANWTHTVARNKDLTLAWHQMAAGGRTPPAEYPDNPTGLIVWSGQLRVSIKGQQPFMATKGSEIDVPFRLPFTLETVGSEPALWLEVHVTGDLPIFPIGTTPGKPRDPAGFAYVQGILGGGDGRYEPGNAPHLEYFKTVVEGGARPGSFMSMPRMFINNIRGPGVAVPPPTNRGHFHFGYDESWLIMEGNVDFLIEGVPFFTASPGDVVTAAQGRWHRASNGGPVGQMDTRVAINPYPYGLHNYSVESGGRQ